MTDTHHPIEIAVATGDGIGPEIMAATLTILEAAGAPLRFAPIELGEKVYARGVLNGIDASAWEVLRRTGVLLKAPLATPQGGAGRPGYKSVNVTLRKSLGLFANVRPVRAYGAFVPSPQPTMDVVVVRENEEDLYAGIEHRQTDDVFQCLKLITRKGCDRIVRYAFEYAVRNGRSRVTCMTKDNIMQMTDGLFHRVFDEIGAEYPDIKKDHMIIDIGAARLATRPTDFDVIVTLNLYGDILSDIAAEITGSVGLAPSANIGQTVAMFEAVHGTAPQIAGKGIANPSGLLLAAVQMLNHLGLADAATRVHNAWLKTIEDGIHPADIYREGVSTEKARTEAFASAVIARLGETPSVLAPVSYVPMEPIRIEVEELAPTHRELVGSDVFVFHRGHVEELVPALERAAGPGLKLVMVTNRGVKVWPNGLPETTTTDHWRCRFETRGTGADRAEITGVLQRLELASVDVIKCEHLFRFDGVAGYSLGQGQ